MLVEAFATQDNCSLVNVLALGPSFSSHQHSCTPRERTTSYNMETALWSRKEWKNWDRDQDLIIHPTFAQSYTFVFTCAGNQLGSGCLSTAWTHPFYTLICLQCCLRAIICSQENARCDIITHMTVVSNIHIIRNQWKFLLYLVLTLPPTPGPNSFPQIPTAKCGCSTGPSVKCWDCMDE